MPSQSFPPDSFRTFGDLLKYLRRREQLTQLELSIAVDYSEAQIGRLEKNQRRPDLTALKALFIPALHLEDEPQLTTRFLELAQSARQEDAPTPGVAPYKGLLFFDESDSELFFGREALTAHLVQRVTDLAMDSSRRFLSVVGASGSGKSSLARAGLAVALQRAGWEPRVFTPTEQPLKMLEATLTSLNPKSKHILILVDQFEETFTLCRDEAARSAFIEKLLTLSQDASGRTTVVIALRADFYSRCAQYPLLRQAVAAQQEYIGQMNVTELRRAIEEPARRGNWEFEPALVEVLLQDIGAHDVGEPEPGALPLLSHALLATWERRRGRTFTMEGYRASGGVRGAIAETAESVFTDQLNQTQQKLARDVFLRLTELGEGTEDTRRRAALAELVRESEEATQLRAVLNMLAEARLITLNEDSAEVAHEALIREWQRLHEWLNQDREGLRLHRHLTESVREWEVRGRDANELYRGARLAQAREWMSANEEHLNDAERTFLAASFDQEQHEALEHEAQHQRELEAAQKLAATEKTRAEEQTQSASRLRTRNRVITTVGSIAVILALLAGTFGVQSNQNAITAQEQQQVAFARELSASAINNLSVDPERSILLALQAVNISMENGQPPLLEAQDALHRALQTSRVLTTWRGSTLQIDGIAYNHAGTQLTAISDDGTVKIWNVSTNKELLTLQAGFPSVNVARKISFSPDDIRLATPAGEHSAKIWDVASGKVLLTLVGHTDEVISVSFSSDGKHIATSSWDGTSKIWDAMTGRELLTLTGQNESVNDIALSPDGIYLATAGEDSAAMIWDAVSGEALYTLPSVSGVTSVAFSPDGKTLATGGYDATWKLWDVSTGQKIFSAYGHISNLVDISFDPTGTRVATASEDGTTRIWDAATGRELLMLSGHASAILGVTFSPDGVHVATASRDTTIKIWDVSPTGGREWFNLIGHTDLVWAVAYSPDGKTIATGSFDGTAKIWDAATGKEIHTLAGHPDTVQGISFSPDATRLLTYSTDGTSKIWDVVSGKELLSVTENAGGVGAAFSPDGKTFAVSVPDAVKIFDAATGKLLLTLTTGNITNFWLWDLAYRPDGKQIGGIGDDGNAYVWDTATGKLLLVLSNEGVQVRGIAYSPDGKWIATTSNDATVKIWDSETGTLLHTLAGHTGPTFGVAFSPDGSYLASTSVDGTVKIWNVADNFTSQPLTLYGHRRAIYRVAFSPDGTRIVTASRDTTARVYAFKIEDLVALAKSRVTRTLTEQECQQYLHVDQCP
ncbi:MAG: nSTAND1 domain-containing NTPase [Anaerolineales bacterium]